MWASPRGPHRVRRLSGPLVLALALVGSSALAAVPVGAAVAAAPTATTPPVPTLTGLTTAQVVWAINGLAPGVNHTIQILALGTQNAAAVAAKVDYDAIVALK